MQGDAFQHISFVLGSYEDMEHDKLGDYISCISTVVRLTSILTTQNYINRRYKLNKR